MSLLIPQILILKTLRTIQWLKHEAFGPHEPIIDTCIQAFYNGLIMNNQQEKILLSNDQKLMLKKLAHHLKPVVQIGKHGVTESLIREIDAALRAHELIKIHVQPRLKEHFAEILSTILRETQSFHIDTIGNIVIVFRKREENSSFDV